MRVLVVTNMYPPHHLGGYELSCRDVVERWRSAGHEVDVLTTDLQLPGVEVRDQPGVRRALRFYWHDHEIVKPSLFGRYQTERKNQRILQGCLERANPDVVSFWHMGAMSLSLLETVRRLELPMVLVVCDDWLIYAPKVDPWFRMFSGRPRLARFVELITRLPTRVQLDSALVSTCFNSDWIRRRAVESSPWALGRTTVVYSGIETSDFEEHERVERTWPWRLLSVGRVEERKGVHVALEALTHLPPDAHLDVVGPADPVYLHRLERLASHLRVADRVRFLGSVPREKLAGLYSSSDVFVFPVLWDEPFGLVPVEAMACGVPVVATGTGGSGEFLVDNVNCLRVPPGDAPGLAAAVERLAENAALRRTLIEAGYATAKQLSVDELATTLEKWHLAAAGLFRDGDPPDRGRIKVGSGSSAGNDS